MIDGERLELDAYMIAEIYLLIANLACVSDRIIWLVFGLRLKQKLLPALKWSHSVVAKNLSVHHKAPGT